MEDLFAADLEEVAPESKAIQEVANYVAAAEYGVSRLGSLPVSRNLIFELHTMLMRHGMFAASSGRLRAEQVAIGPRGSLITEARFVPPPAGTVLDDLFTDWERWNYREDSLPVLARIAVSHYQFETIHPFVDGNGRIGRLIVVMLLMELGPLTGHYLVLSPYLEARRDRYADLLSSTSATGDFDPWVRFFAEAVRHEAALARRRISELLAFRDGVIDDLRRSGLRGTIIEVAERLIERPVLTPTAVARQFDISYQTANRAVSILVSRGILTETTGRTYGRVFVAVEVLRLLELGAE